MITWVRNKIAEGILHCSGKQIGLVKKMITAEHTAPWLYRFYLVQARWHGWHAKCLCAMMKVIEPPIAGSP